MSSRISLSDAQQSAIECRPLDDLPGQFNGKTLTFSDADAMSSWLCEASNAEDAFAEQFKGQESAVYAARAARSLACLMGKVHRA